MKTFSRSMKEGYKLILVALLLTTAVKAPNIEQIGVKKGVKFNGSLNVNTVSYYAHGIEQRRDPFNWFLNSRLSFSYAPTIGNCS